MNHWFTKSIFTFLLVLFFSFSGFGQVSISGQVTDSKSGEPLIGVNILVKGTVLGTITDVQGNFSLSVRSALPIALLVSSVGYERQEIIVDESNVSSLKIQLAESFMLGQEVVVSASRVEENILQSPVSIEKMDVLSVQNTSSDTYYKAIANLKGVDVTSSSINFQIINARGFTSNGNTRFVQLIDGMDTQAPALNFPIGNLNGPSVLDVESVELIPGASSALYGPSAFNGVLLINSKNPFDYQGLSAFVKTGVNHVGKDADHNPSLMKDVSIRYAKSFNNKFAFKVNFSYMAADDWHGTDDFDRNSRFNPFSSIGGANPGSDRLHFQGDEAGINLAIFPFSSAFGVISRATQFEDGSYASQYVNAGDLPNQVATITPYKEVDLIDYGAENFKVNTGLYYRITDKLEASYMYNAGFGTSIYTGAQRYSLSNFGIQQHRFQLRGDNFFFRTYGTMENSGDSYITEFLAKRINDLVVGYRYGDYHGGFNPFENQGKGDLTGYLVDYGIEYLHSLSLQGYQPGDIGSLTGTALLQAQAAAHQYARETVDARYIMDPQEGTITDLDGQVLTFDQLKKRALEGTIPDGPSFADKSAMYHAEGQYDFKNVVDFMDLQVGASFRMFNLGSKGTIFPDTAGNKIMIKEYGAYLQAGKHLTSNFKLSGSVRFDKNQNFKGQINPRVSGVYTFNKTHNLRVSGQTGFRFPTTQGQYINLDIISSRLLGGLPEYYDQYLPDPESNFYYTGASVNAFRNNVFAGQTLDDAAAALVRKNSFNPVKPEQVRSIEFGYKSLINNNFLIDAVYYYNHYTDFITEELVVEAQDDGSGNPNYLTILTSDANNAYAIYTNLNNNVKTQGAAIGLTYSLPRGYQVGGNYNWNKFIGGYDENNIRDFNTPEHKFNVNFGNRKVTKLLGFNVTYRWQDSYRWESSFARGDVPAFSTLDAQVSYKLENLKSIVKVGGSNVLGNYYIPSLGGPNIGAIYYVSVTFDELMN